MPNKNRAEIASRIEYIASHGYQNSTNPYDYHDDNILRQAAADERKISIGEYAEVVHGEKHHVVSEDQTTCLLDCTCSICGCFMNQQDDKYCPSCGALMDDLQK